MERNDQLQAPSEPNAATDRAVLGADAPEPTTSRPREKLPKLGHRPKAARCRKGHALIDAATGKQLRKDAPKPWPECARCARGEAPQRVKRPRADREIPPPPPPPTEPDVPTPGVDAPSPEEQAHAAIRERAAANKVQGGTADAINAMGVRLLVAAVLTKARVSPARQMRPSIAFRANREAPPPPQPGAPIEWQPLVPIELPAREALAVGVSDAIAYYAPALDAMSAPWVPFAATIAMAVAAMLAPEPRAAAPVEPPKASAAHVHVRVVPREGPDVAPAVRDPEHVESEVVGA